MSKELKIHNHISEKQIITSIEKDFSKWLEKNVDELPVPKEQIKELLKKRTW